VLVALLLAALVLAAPARAADRYERPAVGLSVDVPAGWTVVRRPLTACTDPVQRLALRGRGALVLLVERRDPEPLSAYPPRPERFSLPGRADWIPCCAPRSGKGWMLPFRDAGRAFYVYVYLGAPGTRAEALPTLDSLRVRPQR
jgi:hypothetical protein